MSEGSEAIEADGAPLFLLDEVPEGDVVTVDGAEGRHAVDVLRLAAGERVRVSDGRGLLVEGSVLTAGSGALQVQVTARHEVPAPQPQFLLVQALPKGDRGPLAVDLATELGVDR
ncbi:RsmE family RNA methyltransferase, partial [Modestobacter roseus]